MRRLVVLAALALAGCDRGPDTAPVSGAVTLNGKPLADATVLFQPLAADPDAPATGSFGRTGPDGRFTLTMQDSPRPGALVGKHRVQVYLPRKDPAGGEEAGTAETIPPRYNEESKLQFEVTRAGTTEANFALTVP